MAYGTCDRICFFPWMVQFSMWLLFHNVRMSYTYYDLHALLHYVSLTCARMYMYARSHVHLHSLWNWVVESCTTPCHFDMSKNTHVPMSDVTIHPCNWMQSYSSGTTACQFDMWKNAGVPRSNVHPPAN